MGSKTTCAKCKNFLFPRAMKHCIQEEAGIVLGKANEHHEWPFFVVMSFAENFQAVSRNLCGPSRFQLACQHFFPGIRHDVFVFAASCSSSPSSPI